MSDGTSVLLKRLERAAGLAALTTATMASGPCGRCEDPYVSCQSIEEFKALREARLAPLRNADAGANFGEEAGAAGTPSDPSRRDPFTKIAKSWDGESCPTPEQRDAIIRLSGSATDFRYGEPIASSDPGVCCYRITPPCGEGRPFLVGGSARVAELHPSSPLHEASTARDERALLAEAWLRDALMEHASVAAFARLTLQLLALGAPAELVSASQRASLDELWHAEFCFAKASQHASRPLRPGPLNVSGALDDTSLAGLIESNLYEGCIGETLAAVRLKRQAETVRDPELKEALLAISEDEANHAELAFRIMAFCYERAPELTQQAVLRALRQKALEPRAPTSPARESALYLSERLSAAAAEASDHDTWAAILRPLLRRFVTEHARRSAAGEQAVESSV